MNLLIVDDELNIREGMKSAIDWQAYGISRVQTAGSGDEALSLFEKTPFEIVITDIKMPRMSGLELAKQLRQHAPSTKVVILSGFADFEFAKEAITLNVDSYLLKPVDIDELTGLVEKLVGEIPANTANTYLLKQAKYFIRKNYMKPISMKQIAMALNRNPSYFSHAFKQAEGISCIEYVCKLRIEKAKELLLTTDLLTYQVAEQVGFLEYRYFSQIFKKHTGHSPTEYRKAGRGG